MNEIQYAGEHLWIHYCGRFLVLLALFSALFYLIAFIRNHKDISVEWIKSLKTAFIIHAVSVIGIIGLLFFMMTQHYYEYQYAWAHVSDELPLKYILSAFWEGQEGSFLLWMFWNCILGFFFFRFRSKLHPAVLMIILAVNLMLSTMLLGIYIGDSRIGSSPFSLLRHTMNIPLFNNAEYTKLIKGNGLNPLLQNYWNIIHPPTLFLGFASTVVPFAFAFAALIYKEYKDWLKETLPWALFSGFILGTGVLMGGAWAYEALSFGGYWAWDPVENMSLVPWIVLIAGIHTNLVAKATGYSIRATFIFYFLAFILVTYSSFLTRSGILGDSSAHAFTQMGLEWQLVIFCFLTSLFPIIFFIKNYKKIPSKPNEEQFMSREFWMLIGSLILLFSAMLISFTTSIPVYNKILDQFGRLFNTSFESWHRSTPLDPVAHHNQYQIWIAIFVAFLSSASIFLRYLDDRKNNLGKQFFINTGVSIILSLILFGISIHSFEKLHWSHGLLLWSAWLAIVSSIVYLIRFIEFRWRLLGPVLSHGGFGMLLLGILFTGINKNIISHNQFAQEGLLPEQMDEELLKHLTLIKGEKMFMNGYWVLYEKDTFVLKSRIYQLRVWKEDSLNNVTESFTLLPEVQYDNKLTKVAASNPSTKHYINKDIFSLIAQIPLSQTDVESSQKAEDSLQYVSYPVRLNDTVFTKRHYLILKNISNEFTSQDFEIKPSDHKLQLTLEVRQLEKDTVMIAKPGILFRNNLIYKFPYQIDPFQLRIQIPDSIYDVLIPRIENLKYTSIELKKGNEVEIGKLKYLKLNGFTKDIDPEILVPGENEIAIAAQLEYRDDQKRCNLNPIYLIRGNQVVSIPVQSILPGISIKFSKIDPETETMRFDYFIHPDISNSEIPVLISENVPRNDFIVIQVIEFPWINLVWFGGALMLSGLFLSFFVKRFPKANAA